MTSLQKKISSADVIAEMQVALEQATGIGWVNALSTDVIPTMRPDDVLRWLGQAPAMKEWKGGRQAQRLRDFDFTIEQKKYEATLEVLLDEMHADRFVMVQQRINDLATRAAAHWSKLISPLINNGTSQVCYDGQFFFDTDHSEGDSGTQSNDLSVDISALPVPSDQQGSTTAPGAKVVRHVIEQCIDQMLGLKDDQGEPMNEDASEFLVMVPTPFGRSARTAIGADMHYAEDNPLQFGDFSVSVVASPRITWTDSLAVFRTNGMRKAFVRLQREDTSIASKAEGSDYEFDNDAHQYGVDAERAAGYGFWQSAVRAQLV